MVLAMILCTAVNVAAVLFLALVFSRVGRLIDRIPLRTVAALRGGEAEAPREATRAVEILTRLATGKLEALVASVAAHEKQLASSARAELEAAQERAALLDRQLLTTATATHKVSELLRDAQALLDHAADLQIASARLHRTFQPPAAGAPSRPAAALAPVDDEAPERPTVEMRAQTDGRLRPADPDDPDEEGSDGVTVVARRDVLARAAARAVIRLPVRGAGEAP